MPYVGNGVVICGHPRRVLSEDPSPGLKVLRGKGGVRLGRHFGGTGRGGRAAASACAPVDAANACLPCRFRPRAPRLVAMVSTTPHLGLPPGDAGRTASARVFRGPKGAPGVGHPSRCISAADCLRSLLQPRKIEEIKDFLLTARRKDAKCKWAPWTGGGDRGLRDAPRNGRRAPGGRFCPRLLSGFGGFSLSPIRQGAWSGVCSLPSLRRVPRGFCASWCVLGTVNGCEELTR